MKQYFVKHHTLIAFGILITLLALWLQLSRGGWNRNVVERLDHLAYDIRLNLALPTDRVMAPDVVIVDIDEASLRAEGRWPWSRQKMSELVVALKQAGVQTIGFDVAFAEPERNVAQELIEAASRSGTLEHAQYLEQLIPAMDRDGLFAETIKGQNVVLGFLFHSTEEPSVGKLPTGWAFFPGADHENLTIPLMRSYTGNLPSLQKAAKYGGFLNATSDTDGVLRSTPLILRNGDMVYPSLALAVARRHNQALRCKVETALVENSERVLALLLDHTRILTDQYGRVLIPYSGHRGGVPYIPATDILQATQPDQFPQLKGAAVLIGSSALGLADLISAPTGPAFPGVEVHATVLQRILSGKPFPQVPDWADAANAIMILGMGLILTFLCPAFGAMAISFFAAACVALLIGGNLWLWSMAQLSLSPVLPLFTILAIISMNVLYGFFAEARQKRQVRKAFSSYMAPALVDQLVDHPERLSLNGETREMSFLFSDIAGLVLIHR